MQLCVLPVVLCLGSTPSILQSAMWPYETCISYRIPTNTTPITNVDLLYMYSFAYVTRIPRCVSLFYLDERSVMSADIRGEYNRWLSVFDYSMYNGISSLMGQVHVDAGHVVQRR